MQSTLPPPPTPTPKVQVVEFVVHPFYLEYGFLFDQFLDEYFSQ